MLTSITVPQQPLPKISEGLLQTGKGCWAFLKSTPSSTPHSSLPNSISAGVPRARSSNHLKNWVSSVRSTSQDRDTGSTGMKSIFRFSGKTPSRLDRHRSPSKLKRARIISHFEPAHRPKPRDYPRSFLTSHLRTSITVEIVSPGPSRATIEARPERAADRAPAHGRTSLPREGPLGAAGAGRAAPDG